MYRKIYSHANSIRVLMILSVLVRFVLGKAFTNNLRHTCCLELIIIKP